METWGRIPVPWGPEPKAQISAAVRRARWHSDDHEELLILDFDPAEADFPVSYKNAPTSPLPRAKGKSQPLPADTSKWAIIRGAFKDEVLARQIKSLVSSVYRPQSWAEQIPPSLQAWATEKAPKRRRGERPKPRDPFATRSRVKSIDQETQEWADLLPPSLLEWAVAKGVKKTPIERATPLDPFKTRTGVVTLEQRLQIATALERGEWYKVPPSLVRWAVERGIKEADSPQPRRPAVYSAQQKQLVFEALRKGEWCFVYELDDFLPPRLRKWLIECHVKLIRFVGSGRVSGTPVNGYVTEDGTTFYVAEDGATFYVQES